MAAPLTANDLFDTTSTPAETPDTTNKNMVPSQYPWNQVPGQAQPTPSTTYSTQPVTPVQSTELPTLYGSSGSTPPPARLTEEDLFGSGAASEPKEPTADEKVAKEKGLSWLGGSEQALETAMVNQALAPVGGSKAVEAVRQWEPWIKNPQALQEEEQAEIKAHPIASGIGEGLGYGANVLETYLLAKNIPKISPSAVASAIRDKVVKYGPAVASATYVGSKAKDIYHGLGGVYDWLTGQ